MEREKTEPSDTSAATLSPAPSEVTNVSEVIEKVEPVRVEKPSVEHRTPVGTHGLTPRSPRMNDSMFYEQEVMFASFSRYKWLIAYSVVEEYIRVFPLLNMR